MSRDISDSTNENRNSNLGSQISTLQIINILMRGLNGDNAKLTIISVIIIYFTKTYPQGLVQVLVRTWTNN